MSELVEIAPGRFRFVRDRPQPKRSDLPCPNVISDIMDPTEQVDGRYYTSKRAFRAVGRALGLTEVGNENLKRPPKQRGSADPKFKQTRREAIKRAIAQAPVRRR